MLKGFFPSLYPFVFLIFSVAFSFHQIFPTLCFFVFLPSSPSFIPYSFRPFWNPSAISCLPSGGEKSDVGRSVRFLFSASPAYRQAKLEMHLRSLPHILRFPFCVTWNNRLLLLAVTWAGWTLKVSGREYSVRFEVGKASTGYRTPSIRM